MPGRRLAKLTRPRLHDAVARERLFRSLDAKREHPVVWVSGPPGSGKTTLVASYIEATGIPALWYLLDPADADPATFFYYLAQAAGSRSRRGGDRLPALTEAYLLDLDGFAKRFLRALFARLPQGVLLALDNYHDVRTDSALHAMFKAALTEIPPGSNLIVISRAPPPALFARERMSGTIELLTWEELRLDPEETAAIVARRRAPVAKLVADIHARAGGWAAGVRLLLEAASPTPPGGEMPLSAGDEATFDYFAAEIFDTAPEPLQQLLLRTAFLPQFTLSMAVTLSGQEHGRLVEDLYKRRLFIERAAGSDGAYRYHDLFRAFLLARAKQRFAAGAFAELAAAAASLLAGAGLREDAFAAFVLARAWESAERLLLEHARELLVRGRWQTLAAWVEALPAERLEANPWLQYWRGRSKALVNAAEACPLLEAAYFAFQKQHDIFGQLQCAASVVEALHFVVHGWDSMDTWMQRLKSALALQAHSLAADDELRVQAALFWAAENSRNPTDPIVAPAVEKVLELLPLCTDVNLRVSVANILHYHAQRALHHEAFRVAAREAHAVIGSADLSADRHALYFVAEGFAHIAFARYPEALRSFDHADTVIAAHGLVGRDHICGVWRAYCHCVSGNVASAQAALAHAETLRSLNLHVITHVLQNVRAWMAFASGDLARALECNAASIGIAETLGPYYGISSALPHRAYMLIAGREHELAQQVLNRIRGERALVEYARIGAAVNLLDAWLALQCNHPDRCRAYLHAALEMARDPRERLRLRWYPRAMQALIPLAMRDGIQSEAAREVARECALQPPPDASEAWPWPVKIRTLGRFDVVVGGEPLRFGRKSPKRTLALLKALVAFGGKAVPEERLADALWPDLEGDAAAESLAAALHRLRRLLGGNEAIEQTAGRLSINPRHCFVDAWAFEAELTRSGWQGALDLYGGAFLEGDQGAAWSASMRERLRSKFVRAVQAAAGDLEASGQHEEAIGLYTRGLEADELVEAFYQGLIRCQVTLGRTAEAVRIFQRLSRTLATTLGVQPSADTRKLYEALVGGN